MTKQTTDIALVKQEINEKIKDKETFYSLLKTTFKDLSAEKAKSALLEGMLRGFSFNDFLEKNVYAIPFKDKYSLVTSIDYARKVGMRSGVVGKSKPEFEETEDGKIISCTVTVKRKVNDYVGEYSATVYFDEYTTKDNLWKSKPRTMIAKVAEMHALRMACPEDASAMYIQEEYEQEAEVDLIDEDFKQEIDSIDSVDKLKTYYQKNKGRGKDFDKYVTKRKNELQNS